MADKVKIAWEVKENIGYVTLTDEPENKMDTRFFHELYELTSKTIPAAEVTAIIVSGKGRHFSSGADLEDLAQTIRREPDNRNFLMDNYRSFKFFDDLTIPVIMAIRGVCLGAGLEMALHGHFRLCSKGALLGLPEATFGLIPGAGGIQKMIQLAGKSKTMELILRGNSYTAEQAVSMRVADAVFPKKDLMKKAVELAKLTANGYRRCNKKEYLRKMMQKEL